jgi:hypothetical protein
VCAGRNRDAGENEWAHAPTDAPALGHGPNVRRLVPSFVLSCWLAAATTGCGGRVPGDGGDGGPEADGQAPTAGDEGTVAFPVCPGEAPVIGTTCFMPQQGCIYPGRTCRAFVCDDSGHWQSATEGC